MELVLGEPAARRGWDLGGHHRRKPMFVQPGQVGAGAISAVAIDHGPGRLPAALLALAHGKVAEQGGGDHGVAGGR